MGNADRSATPFRGLMTAALLLGLAHGVPAEEPVPAPPTVSVSLLDGRTFVGTIVREEVSHITLWTEAGIEVRIPKSSVASITPVLVPARRFLRRDPHDSRLLFAPTGRPLPKGEGYFSDHYVLFPGLTYGVTDGLSVSAGASMVPAVGLSDQLLFASARLAHQPSEHLALSAGALYAVGAGEAALLVFGVGTFGRPERSLTVGLGFAGTRAKPRPTVRLRSGRPNVPTPNTRSAASPAPTA